MAIDNSPPRLKLITTIAIITIVTLVGLNFVLESYYAYMSDQAALGKIAPTTDRNRQLEAEQAALTNAQMPIDQAMAELAKGRRTGLVAPQPSDDVTALTGWSKLPKPAPAGAGGGASPATDDAATDADADAGTETESTEPPRRAPAADAGARRTPAPAADGGAPRAPRAPAADGGAPRPAPRRDAGGGAQ